MNGSKNTAFANLWDALKRVLRVKFRSANSLHLKKKKDFKSITRFYILKN